MRRCTANVVSRSAHFRIRLPKIGVLPKCSHFYKLSTLNRSLISLTPGFSIGSLGAPLAWNPEGGAMRRWGIRRESLGGASDRDAGDHADAAGGAFVRGDDELQG